MLIRIFSPTECGLIRDADLKKCGLNRMTTVLRECTFCGTKFCSLFFSHSTQSLESITFGLIATGQLTPRSRQSVFASSWGTGISYLFCMQAIGKASLCPFLLSTKGILGKSKRVGPAIPFCHTMVIVSAGTRSVLLKHPPNMEDQSERYPFLQFLPRCGKLVNQWAPLQDVPHVSLHKKSNLTKDK